MTDTASLETRLQTFWEDRQFSVGSASGEKCFELTGWARSVGGANPYLVAFSRARTSFKDLDASCATVEVCELPAARSCTYVVPSAHFACALTVGASFGQAEIKTAEKYLNFSRADLDILCVHVLDALTAGPLDPAGLRLALGDKVRSFGEEGKKRGTTTSLPLALGLLQTEGQIRRISADGRFDSQRYRYEKWSSGPLSANRPSDDEADAMLAELYWNWTGIASMAHFRWFSGFTAKRALAAASSLDLQPIQPGSDLLARPKTLEEFGSWAPQKDGQYRFLSSLDNLILLRRDLPSVLRPEDVHRQSPAGSKGKAMGALADLDSHPIFHRGLVVGLWEFDPETSEIAAWTFVEPNSELSSAKAEVEEFIREQLGDFRNFSLDSPESRKPRLRQLREAQLAEHGKLL